MSVIDQAVKANEQYARTYDSKRGARPQSSIAVVTCMDPRLSDLEGIFGLENAEIEVLDQITSPSALASVEQVIRLAKDM